MLFNYFDTLVRAQKGYARAMEPICKEWALTRNEMDVLMFLANNPDMNRAVDIVNGRGLSKSHVSMSVSNLEKRGHLSRQEDPADRRSIHLALTDLAKPIVEAGRQAQRQFFGCVYKDVSPEEMAIWRQITEKVIRNIMELDTQQNGSK